MFATGTSIWDTLDFDSAEAVEAEGIRAELRGLEGEISERRARQVALLRRADRLQLDTADGARCMKDWVVSILDVAPQTAYRMAHRASSDQSDIEENMASGVYGLDRASFLCQLRELDGPERVISDSLQYSLGFLFGLVEKLRRISPSDEQMSFDDRYMVAQPFLDQMGGRFWGQTTGTDWETITRALLARESQLPSLPTQSQGQRRVDALASICLDSLTATSGEDGETESAGRAVVVAEVFVDAGLAASTGGEAGVTLSTGPRVGPNTLAEILCTGKIRVIAQGEDGRPIGVSDLGEAIPPAVRAYVLDRDLGQCQADCSSRYRLQPHHIRPRSEGGDHDPDNLITLCWYHHHVAIHQMGMTIDPNSPPHRRRLTWPTNHGPPARAP